MLGRAPATALRAPSSIWRNTLSSQAGLQTRCFSCTSERRAFQVVDFPETSSAKLDEALDEIRHKIILPAYLPHAQRSMLHRRQYKERLEADPITMELDGVKLRFRYTPVETLPNTKASVRNVLKLMQTPEDVRLIPALLEGVVARAGRKLDPVDYLKIIRKAHHHDCMDVVFQCVEAYKTTGLRLHRHEVINTFLAVLQNRVAVGQYDEKATAKALGWASRAIDMLENPDLRPEGKEAKIWSQDYVPHQDPLFLAARLHLAAARAVKHQGGQDMDGTVTKHAEELVKRWPEGKGLFSLHNKEAYEDAKRLRYLKHPDTFLWIASPILKGLRWAAEVTTNESLASQLRARAEAVQPEVQWGVDASKANYEDLGEVTGDADSLLEMQKAKGLAMYNLLLTEQSPKEG